MIDLTTVPSLPGVYIFKDASEKVLYVGKAKNLKNRLKSYFQSSELDERKKKMVQFVKDFSYIVTSNEYEALVLEANLIKEYKPPYNVLLRDDKNYPYLRITITEDWPRIDVVRKPKRDGNLYFGPYVPAQSMWEALSFIRRNFPIRTCKYNLNKPIRPCVQYQMKRCPAPCAGLIKKEDYMKGVEEVVLFLKGKKTELLDRLYEKMQKLAQELKFEEAAVVRDQIRRLERIFSQQRVVSQAIEDMDVIGLYMKNSKISVNVLFVRNGLLIGSKDWIVKKAFYENEGELISSVVEALYSKDLLIPSTIMMKKLPESLDEIKEWLKVQRGAPVELKTPSSEEERALLDMALNNAKIHIESKLSPVETTLEELKQRLNLIETPSKIGAFDVSTLFGAHSVGSFIYWEDGNFSKNFYRHLKIKEPRGIDDYSAMKEIVLRVVRKFDTDEGVPKPDLILIDGGLGHLNTALKVINELKEELPCFAIAKEPDRLVFPDGKEILLEDKKSSSLLLKKIRNEAHRFAISYHKKLRKKATFQSVLEKIPGIGKKRRLTLLRHFGSIEKIKTASLEEIASLPGFNLTVAQKVIEALN
ncbi:excinuclease ABC subunit UvrC [Thermodesulfovibrio sp.]|uniref:UvrABC system protein C n=1 Tax=Thermodesulfovibrio aggregans TaxID=86166 RepID=A0A2J6WQ55_9BACT|nr:MAG: excinuclease ABC subunit UvrC [Thermodesulfovibrio aggregans]